MLDLIKQMPPKRAEPKPFACSERDAKSLGDYAVNPNLTRPMFVKALANSGLLDRYAGTTGYNECIYSYPGSPWHSIYMLDAQGNKFWDSKKGKIATMYFTVGLNEANEFIVTSTTTDISKTGLSENSPCKVSSGRCVSKTRDETSAKKMTATEAAILKAAGRLGTTTGAGPSVGVPSQVSAEVMAELLPKMSNIHLTNEENRGSTEKAPREYFEAMKDKMSIITWMVDNMTTQDLVSCIQKGSLSADDIRRAEIIGGTAPTGFTRDDTLAARAAASLNPQQVQRAFKRLSKDDIIRDLKGKYSNADERSQAIVGLCAAAGKKFTAKKNKQGKWGYLDFDGNPMSEDDVLDYCAESEAERIRQRLATRWTGVMGTAATAKRSGLIPPMPGPRKPTFMTAAEIADGLKARYPNADERSQAIVGLCAAAGKKFTPKKNKQGKWGYIDFDGNPVSEEDVLEFCAETESTRMRQRMASRWTGVMKKTAARRGKQAVAPGGGGRAILNPIVQKAFAGPSRVTAASIIAEVSRLDPQVQKERIIALGVPFGYTSAVSTGKRGGLVIKNPEGEPLLFEDALEEIAQLMETQNTAFGRKRRSSKKAKKVTKRKSSKKVKKTKKVTKRKGSKKVSSKQMATRNRFKMAAKKCKGSKNYRACFSKAISKRSSFGKVSKTYTKTGLRRLKYTRSRGRKSPNVSATSYPVGTVKKGNNGKMWVIRKTRTGVKRWVLKK